MNLFADILLGVAVFCVWLGAVTAAVTGELADTILWPVVLFKAVRKRFDDIMVD